jgi:hypothetical protein
MPRHYAPGRYSLPYSDWRDMCARLDALNCPNWAAYRKRKWWRQLVARYTADANRRQTCCACNTKLYVELHHIRYRNLGLPAEIEDIVPMCRSHHEDVHRLIRMGTESNLIRATRRVVREYRAWKATHDERESAAVAQATEQLRQLLNP